MKSARTWAGRFIASHSKTVRGVIRHRLIFTHNRQDRMAAGLCRFNTAARGVHQADVRIFQEVRKPLLLSQVVALGLAQALRDIAVDEVAHTPCITTLQPLAAPELDPGGGGGAPSPRSSAAPRLHKAASTTNHLSESTWYAAFLTLMVHLFLSSQRSGTTSCKMP